MNHDVILSRIRKLLTLADPARGATEAEAASAMAIAKRLMAEHHLQMAHIVLDDPSTLEVIQRIAYGRRGCVHLKKFQKWLAAVVAKLTSTQLVSRQNRSENSVQITYVGEEADVAVACAMFPLLMDITHKWCRSRLGSGFTPSHRNYCEGFAQRLWERAAPPATHLTEKQSTALVRLDTIKVAAIGKFLASKIPNLKQARRHSTTGAVDDAARAQGYRDGENVNLKTEKLLRSKEAEQCKA